MYWKAGEYHCTTDFMYVHIFVFGVFLLFVCTSVMGHFKIKYVLFRRMRSEKVHVKIARK